MPSTPNLPPQLTLTHASAACASLNRTLATPCGSLSKSTTFVTSPSLAHSSRMASLISNMAAGSSSSSCSVNMCLRMTTLSHFLLTSCSVDGSSSSQSVSLLHSHPSQPRPCPSPATINVHNRTHTYSAFASSE